MVDKADVWSKSLANTSPFFDALQMTRWSAESCEMLVCLCQQLLLQHVARIDSLPGVGQNDDA